MKMKMKQLIGNHRFLYNEGVKYLSSLPRGFFKPEKGNKKQADFIKYKNEYIKVETGGEYAFGIIPTYYIDDKGEKKQASQTDFKKIREYLKATIPDWFIKGNFPIHTIDQAAREVGDNFKKIIDSRKKDKKKFYMSFKSKQKSVIETITMEASSINKDNKIYVQKFKDIDSKLHTKENLKNTHNKEYKISYNRHTYKFYVNFSVPIENINVENKKEWCSIDPGEKTFTTIYNPFDREILFLANGERDSFGDHVISKLQRKISKCADKQKKIRLTRALQLQREKDKNKRKEMHHKIANYLCSNFKHIIIPSYRTKNMKLSSNVNKSIRNLGYFQFLTFLKHKCKEHDTKLYIVEEHYTTKACCKCGKLNKPDDRKYKCSECKIEINRDANGSINIGLKHLQSKV